MSRLITKMKLFRIAGYTFLDVKINKEIFEKLGKESVENKTHKNKSNWLKQVLRMENIRISKLMMSYKTSLIYHDKDDLFSPPILKIDQLMKYEIA